MRRRLIIALVVLLALAGVTVLLWAALDWPPPRLLMKYGLPPAGGPTGRTKTVAGLEFVEIEEGYCQVRRQVIEQEGDFLGRALRPLGLPIGRPEINVPEYSWDCFVEVPRDYWIATGVIGAIRLGEIEKLSTWGAGPCEWRVERVPGSFRFALAEETWLAFATNAVEAASQAPEYAECALLEREHPTKIGEDVEPVPVRWFRTLPLGEGWRRSVGYHWLLLDSKELYRLVWIPPENPD